MIIRILKQAGLNNMAKADIGPKLTKQERFDKRRVEILRGAARVFGRLGYHGTSLNNLGTETEMTPAALYYYVKSKDEMLHECGKFALDLIQTALDESKNGERNGATRLRTFFRSYAQIMGDDFGRCFVLTTPEDLPSDMEALNREGRRNLDRAIREMIEEGRADGSIKDVSGRLLADILFATFNAIARRPLGYRGMVPDDLADSYLDIILGA
ncbi:TetR/AcrR family transcriptional regulator [Novosphingobium aquae]|uniref:TetR/AcrR family transcriptional regulator n=1 Tax=Novosphingobium aquae TaxID=3133435 RepID=A0ABU8SA10_9SPHN